jgi:type IV secretion system protein VirB8
MGNYNDGVGSVVEESGNNPDKFAQLKKGDVFKEGNDFEASRIHNIEKSERRAWYFAAGAGVIAIAEGLAIFQLVPLHKTEPYVLSHNVQTGELTIVSASNEVINTLGEATDKSNLAKYVIAHESYDWHDLQRDYDTVRLMSASDVFEEYDTQFRGERAKDKVIGNKAREIIKIISVTPSTESIGTIRYTKTVKRLEEQNMPGTTTYWVATIAFKYHVMPKLKESERLSNPAGFTVTSFRSDPELGAAR